MVDRPVANTRILGKEVVRFGKQRVRWVEQAALRERVRGDGSEDITSNTRVRELAELWFLGVRAAVDAGEKSPGTQELYRSALDLRIIPGMGELRLREVTVGRVSQLLTCTRENQGPMAAKRVRTVLNGMMTLAARHDAIKSNPVRDSGHITGTKPSTPAVALDLDQVRDLRAKLAGDTRAVGRRSARACRCDDHAESLLRPER
jgi:hypothetical protein